MSAVSRDRALLRDRFAPDSPLRIHVITSSDRAAAGVYEDVGGRRVRERVSEFFAEAQIPFEIRSSIVPDEPDRIRSAIEAAREAGASLIITTGGTGVGPRDCVPDVVLDIAEKVIPGIMEYIRLKYGADKPKALLSRSVAATIGATLVVTLPGTPKAVDEYLHEIFKTLEHLLCILQGLEAH